MFEGIKRFFLHRAMQKVANKHQPQPLPDEVKNIAVWQFGGVGDMLLATPVLQALAKKYVNANIYIWCSYPDFAAFLKRLPQVQGIDAFKIYDFDLRSLRKPDSRNQLLHIMAEMKKQDVDLLVNLHHPRQLDWWAVEWLVLAQLKPRFVLGFSPDALQGSVLDAWLPSSVVTTQHYITTYQQLLAKIDVESDTQLSFPIDEQEQAQAQALLEDVPDMRVCLHMGGRRLSMENKMWDVECFIDLAKRLLVDGITPVLIGVDSEADAAEVLLQAVPQAVSLVGQTNLGTMAAVIGQSKLLVGHDSGPFHIAVAMQTPVVVICGRPDAEPEYLQYEQDDVVVLTADSPQQIAVDDVYQAAKGLLA